MPLQATLSLACFLAGTGAFIQFFYLVPRLRKERAGPPSSPLQRWFPWLPGKFTPAGERLRRRMNRLMVLGWVFLVLGLFLSPS